jgi:hypothetical protein
LNRELRDIHEYEADNGVLQSGVNATKYQLLLIKKAAGKRACAIANSFNHSKIKKRITMMLKKESSRGARLKTLVFVPLAAASLLAFARPEIVRMEESLKQSDTLKGRALPETTVSVGATGHVTFDEDSLPATETNARTVGATVMINGYFSMSSHLNKLGKITGERERILNYTSPDEPVIRRMDEDFHSITLTVKEGLSTLLDMFPGISGTDVTNGSIVQFDTITEKEYLQYRLILQTIHNDTIKVFSPLINESWQVRLMNQWAEVQSGEELPTTITFDN